MIRPAVLVSYPRNFPNLYHLTKTNILAVCINDARLVHLLNQLVFFICERNSNVFSGDVYNRLKTTGHAKRWQHLVCETPYLYLMIYN